MGTEVRSAMRNEAAKGNMTRSRERAGRRRRWRMVVARRRATSERKMAAAKTKRVMARRWRRGVDLGLVGSGRRKEKARVALRC
jgi:hypothetical protein